MKRLAAALLPMALAGCYSYTPLATPSPESGTKVALVLSDAGRVGMGPQVGPGTARIEGKIVGASDTGYVLSVSDVFGIGGSHAQWAGETVYVQKAYVANSMERRFSRGRTVFVAGGAAAAVATFVLSRDLLGIGGSGISNLPWAGGGGGQNQ
jgi:hypothetical protein